MHTYEDLLVLLNTNHWAAKKTVEDAIEDEALRLHKLPLVEKMNMKKCRENARRYLVDDIESNLARINSDSSACVLEPNDVFTRDTRALTAWAVARYIYDNNLKW